MTCLTLVLESLSIVHAILALYLEIPFLHRLNSKTSRFQLIQNQALIDMDAWQPIRLYNLTHNPVA